MRTTALELAAATSIRMLASTWRLEIKGETNVSALREVGVPVVFTVWHAFLLLPLWHRRGEGITLLVSEHGDAGYLARAASRWGYRIVRGSSTRGAVKGTLGLVRVLSSGGDVALTPDGPTGPARVAKTGAVDVAARSGAAIVPIGAGASSWWRLRSWDRFSIPKPWSRVRVVYGEPLRFEKKQERTEDMIGLLRHGLDEVTEAATW